MRLQLFVFLILVISEAYQSPRNNVIGQKREITNNENKSNTIIGQEITESKIFKETNTREVDNLFRIRRQTEGNETKIIKETEERVLKTLNSSVETCGGIYSQPQFIIETPNYPSNYPNNLDCLFIFKGPLCETNYTLQFLDFNIEDTIGCTTDRLEVKYKDALCGIHEGIRSYVTRNGILELNFITNENASSRGFRILVSRSACLKYDETTTEGPKFFAPPENLPNTTYQSPPLGYLPSKPDSPYPPPEDNPLGYLPSKPDPPYPPPEVNPLYPPSGYPPPNPKQRACCASTYSSKRFYISSPGFPRSNEHPTECTFTIFRANPKVCRARIIFHYFSIGTQESGCPKGYLQIDGKLICGCRTGMRLLSPFHDSFGNTKVFRLNNLALPSNTYTGFAIEIIQDECPERYLPSDFKEPKNFHFYDDQVNRIVWPNSTNEELLIKSESIDNTEFFEPIDLGFKPRVVKHVYYFDSPNFYDEGYDVTYTYNKPRDIEQSTYIDTSDLSFSFPNNNGDNSMCALWGVAYYSELVKDVLWQRMPKCNELNVYPEMSKCKDYNFIKGYFQSPGYPYYYPKNLNLCYRFSKQRGFCKIRLIMLDFQVDQSFDCGKDYLLINGNFRYCGKSLANTFTLFDMIGKNYEEIKFVTGGQSTGRGFRGIYEQIPCAGVATHPHPHHHHHNRPHTTPPPGKATPPAPPSTTYPPDLPCSRTIMEGYFTIDIYDYGKDTCDFVVKKSKDDVCRLEILFSTFDLDCNTENLLIKGEKFCGLLSGREMSFDFDKDEIEIQYKRFSLLSKGTGLKMHLVGRQVSENCMVKIPPVQRVLKGERRQGKEFNLEDNVSKNNSSIVVLEKKFKEICGVVINVKTSNTSAPLCDVITGSEGEALNCSSVSEKAFYVPYNKSNKLELKFKNAKMAREVEFKEITCDNKFIL